MKKLLAMLIALMMLTVSCVASAESAIHITTATEISDNVAAMFGMSADALKLLNSFTGDLTITQNGFRNASLYNGEAVVDYSIEVQDGKLYIGSSLLDQPLYLNPADLASMFPQLTPFFVDWNGLINELGSLNYDFNNTMTAAMKVSIIESGDTTTIAADATQLSDIVDALAGDLLATEGLEAVLSKYLGVTDLAAIVNGAADQLKAAFSDLDGSVVITYTSSYSYDSNISASANVISINVPLHNATWTFNYNSSYTCNYSDWSYDNHESMSLVYTGSHETREYSYTMDSVDYASTYQLNVNDTQYGEEVCLFNLTASADGVTGLFRAARDAEPCTFTIVPTEDGGKLTLTLYGTTVEGIYTRTDNGFKVTLGTEDYTALIIEGSKDSQTGDIVLAISVNNGDNSYEKISLVVNMINSDAIAIKVLYNDTLLVTETVAVEYIEFDGELVSGKDAALNILTLTADQQDQITETLMQKLIEKLPEDLTQMINSGYSF